MRRYLSSGDSYVVGRYNVGGLGDPSVSHISTMDDMGGESVVVLTQSELETYISVLQERLQEIKPGEGDKRRYRFNAHADSVHFAHGCTVKVVKRFSNEDMVKVEIVKGDLEGEQFVCMRSELTSMAYPGSDE